MLDFGRTLDTGDWVAHRACLADTISMDFQRLTGVPATRVAADDWVTFADAILSPTRRHHTYSNFKVDMNGAQAFAVVYQRRDIGGPLILGRPSTTSTVGATLGFVNTQANGRLYG